MVELSVCNIDWPVSLPRFQQGRLGVIHTVQNWDNEYNIYVWWWQAAIKQQVHVTRASLKQANRAYLEGHFFICLYISKSSTHASSKLHGANWGSLSWMMWKFDHDQTHRHGVVNKSWSSDQLYRRLIGWIRKPLSRSFYCYNLTYK